jgi:CPA1 family monovalent cation:H+ antiporter
MRGAGTVLALVVLAPVVATFARRWRIPASSLPVVAGIVVAWPASCAAT